MLPGTTRLVAIPPTCQPGTPNSPPISAPVYPWTRVRRDNNRAAVPDQELSEWTKKWGSSWVLTARLKQTGLSFQSSRECWCSQTKGRGQAASCVQLSPNFSWGETWSRAQLQEWFMKGIVLGWRNPADSEHPCSPGASPSPSAGSAGAGLRGWQEKLSLKKKLEIGSASALFFSLFIVFQINLLVCMLNSWKNDL